MDAVLVQNPPSAPLLLAAWIFCRTRPIFVRRPRPGLVVDWHNLGYTMFDSLSDGHPVRCLARLYERSMAPLADGHLTVTSAMKDWLARNFGVPSGGGKCAVLRDRPPDFFRPSTVEERHVLMRKLGPEFGGEGGSARLRPDRPALVVSSTSWTPDEDFGLLLDACVDLDRMAQRRNEPVDFGSGPDRTAGPFPRVMVVVTGKGPQKAMYQDKISRLDLTYVSVHTLWLEPGDYPLLLGCADLGVSLHSSTSGLDLPMKVLDMFGCGVPVCALDFGCLNELVEDGTNGRVFRTAPELASQMFGLLGTLNEEGADRSEGELSKLSAGVKNGLQTRWGENWDRNARDVILGVCPGEARDGPGIGNRPCD